MKIIFLSILFLTCVVGCGKDAASTLKDKFGLSPSANVQVKHYEWSGLGMDHWYIWALEPADPSFIQSLVNSANLTRVPATDHVGGLGGPWPVWWPQSSIESLPEHYHREGSYEYWHVWVDSANDLIYIQWFDS